MLEKNNEANNTQVVVQVDKTVVKITGLSVKGLNIQDLEEKLREKVKGLIRVIGVTGDSLEMDVYGIDAEDILRDKDGIIKVISTTDGIKATDVVQLLSKNIRSVDIDNIPDYISDCVGERWVEHE